MIRALGYLLLTMGFAGIAVVGVAVFIGAAVVALIALVVAALRDEARSNKLREDADRRSSH